MGETAPFCAPVAVWFERRFREPTGAQAAGWPEIARGRDTLIAAPTGSGKTLAAFLHIIDRLVRQAIAGTLEDRLEALYVSPLRALSHDIHRNLEEPLREIREVAAELGYSLPEIRAAVRTGDTPARDRQAMLRRPPHLLVTTPESLFVLLTAERSRAVLAGTSTVIVDEIHALARDKRGSHLALSLERLDALCGERPPRIGLSATQRPIDAIARFLVGTRNVSAVGVAACSIVDLGHQRDLDLGVDLPSTDDLGAVASHEQWDDLLDGLADRIREHQTTLVFVNTRRLAERVAHRLGERLGVSEVAAHHGSLSRERRLRVEGRLKAGELSALVATASLELGIDIGSVDCVCQIGSPRSISTFLQRVGRSGHTLGARPKGRLFPTSRDELAEAAALVRAVRAGRLDRICPPVAPLDILAQQIVGAVACEPWAEDDLFALMTGADPFAGLPRGDFDAVVTMLSDGFETPKGRRGAHLHRDRLAGVVRPRRGARLAAIRSGGAIPDVGDYRVVLDPSETFIGTVNEDWAIESMAGDVFLLGTHTWRIRRVESGVVRVVDAEGAPPTIPFWLGEAPARTAELSEELSRLRAEIDTRLAAGQGAARRWLERECELPASGCEQLERYVRIQKESLGIVPTREDLVVERFFDEAGGMQLVIHSPHGARINRGFGLALRKRFCRSFNQELQAAATDDAIVLSLGNPQTFPLDSIKRFLSSNTIADVLSQAMLGSPLFAARWRWNATRSLAVLRYRGSGRMPFPIQRMQADDLLAAAFPDQTACQEHVTFPIDIPDHPLVRQTVRDCLEEAADIEGLRALLADIESGAVRVHGVDTVEPSPFAHEILNAKPYAFLDDAPLEERRTRAVAMRGVLPESASDLARLDPKAIARVRDEASPDVRTPDELYELLCDQGVARVEDLPVPTAMVDALVAAGRGAWVGEGERRRLFAVEHLARVRAIFPGAPVEPEVQLPERLVGEDADREQALDAAVRGHLSMSGPATAAGLSARLGTEEGAVVGSLVRLEGRGIAVRGFFDLDLDGEQFCDRSLLARIHRYTLASLRKQIEPVSARDFLAFLLRYQHLHPDARLSGESGLARAIEQLAGFEAPAAAWEAELFASRVDGYVPEMLDALCLNGSVAWARLRPSTAETTTLPSRITSLGVFPREDLDALLFAARAGDDTAAPDLHGAPADIRALLAERGALFSREIEVATGLPAVQLGDGLWELIARGLVTCDGFAPLRRLLRRGRGPDRRRPERRPMRAGPEGRWGLLSPLGTAPDADERAEGVAWRLLHRYGVVFRDLLAREWVPAGWREVHRALRRLEARGLVRGGRFVSGFTGEQFALPEVITSLRRERTRARDGVEVRVPAADPLNLAGILTPGPRVPSVAGRTVIFADGLPVAYTDRGRRRAIESPASDGHRYEPPTVTGENARA